MVDATLTDRKFWLAYERLSESGTCDSPGGVEYARVRAEWIAAGRPDDIEEFICRRANAGPDDVWEAEKQGVSE